MICHMCGVNPRGESAEEKAHRLQACRRCKNEAAGKLKRTAIELNDGKPVATQGKGKTSKTGG